MADRKPQECLLMVGWYAGLLQGLIAALAASSLLYKRHYLETDPRRPHMVWLMDMGKQCTQGVFVHFTNIGLAILMAELRNESVESNGASAEPRGHGHGHPYENGQGRHKDECALYFISFGMDTFVGVFIIWGLLRSASHVARK